MTMTEITQKKILLIGRVTAPGYQATERDVSEAQELVSQYIDELERLEKTSKPYREGVNIVIDGQVKHFDSVDEFSEWLSGKIS